jgi:hypothetical protein
MIHKHVTVHIHDKYEHKQNERFAHAISDPAIVAINKMNILLMIQPLWLGI